MGGVCRAGVGKRDTGEPPIRLHQLMAGDDAVQGLMPGPGHGAPAQTWWEGRNKGAGSAAGPLDAVGGRRAVPMTSNKGRRSGPAVTEAARARLKVAGIVLMGMSPRNPRRPAGRGLMPQLRWRGVPVRRVEPHLGGLLASLLSNSSLLPCGGGGVSRSPCCHGLLPHAGLEGLQPACSLGRRGGDIATSGCTGGGGWNQIQFVDASGAGGRVGGRRARLEGAPH